MKYLFILGNNPELSSAEISAVLPSAKIIANSKDYLVVDTPKFDHQALMDRLGGTIKIAAVLGKDPEFGPVLGTAQAGPIGKRFNFGFSFYGQKPSNIGMRMKGWLKEKGISARLVTSKDPALSSVIITKEKCSDFVIVPGFFCLTLAVQDFKEYGKRDFGRPAADAFSGMLPPKAAKMMLNLAQAAPQAIILDPFCGSGTVLSEALAMGYSNLIGTDLSEKAITDTKKNLHWLAEEFKIKEFDLRIEQADAAKLSAMINDNSIDAIVTEPFLGQPIKGNESDGTIRKIIAGLEDLYVKAFEQFHKILKSGGRLVIVIPEWHVGAKPLRMDIFGRIERLGFKRIDQGNLIYKRENQKVWRNITIWEK